MTNRARIGLLALALAGGGLAGCQYAGDTAAPEIRRGETNPVPSNAPRESLFGEGGLTLFGRGDATQDQGGALGVNSLLWRASLDTISFMPLASADPFGGVILTDWFSPPETPEERFKLNIFILGRQLRADGVKVSVFRQQRAEGNSWLDAAVEPRISVDLENAILTRARQLRIDTAGQ